MKLRMIRRYAAQGFTLIELLLVLVILTALAAVVVPKFVGRGKQAKIAQARRTSRRWARRSAPSRWTTAAIRPPPKAWRAERSRPADSPTGMARTSSAPS